MRDERTKKALIEFLNDPENKDLRFWQALTAFTQRNIYFSKDAHEGTAYIDTFYLESDKEAK